MINIDWSYAPSGATHFHKGDIMYRPHWRKSGFYCDLGLEAFGWIKDTYPSPISECIERPKKQEAWDGEDLPPVGTVCDMHIYDFGWITGTVVVHIDLDEPTAVAHNGEEVFHGNASDFRPIKTAEQVAAEEREKAISDMMEVTSDGISCIGQDDALALYKAGYRKQ